MLWQVADTPAGVVSRCGRIFVGELPVHDRKCFTFRLTVIELAVLTFSTGVIDILVCTADFEIRLMSLVACCPVPTRSMHKTAAEEYRGRREVVSAAVPL